MRGGLLVFIACFGSVIILLFNGVMGHGVWRQFESSRYPFTTGEITHSEMTRHMTIRNPQTSTTYGSVVSYTYGVDIRYNYVVNGRHFFGTRYRYDFGFSDYSWAANAVAEHPVHSQSKVYFDANDPSDSILSPDLDGGDLMLVLLLIPFNMVMVGLCTAAGAHLKQRVFPSDAGGLKIIVDGPRTNIRLPRYKALVWGMVATGLLSFISVFILGFSTHMHPPMGIACFVIFLVIAAGVATYIWQWRKVHSGDEDLILDETWQTIGLPETCGRKVRVTVKRSEIDRLTVETIEHHSSQGGVYYTYAPTLWLRRGALIETEKLVDWTDRQRAEAFTEWLGQRLNLPGAPAGVATMSQ